MENTLLPSVGHFLWCRDTFFGIHDLDSLIYKLKSTFKLSHVIAFFIIQSYPTFLNLKGMLI